MELFSQQRIQQQQEAQDRAGTLQMAGMVLQARQAQEQRQDRDFVFHQSIAANTKYPMQIRLAAGNKAIKMIDPTFVMTPEHLDPSIQLLKDMTADRAAGKPLDQYGPLIQSYLEQGMIGVEQLPATIQAGQSLQQEKVNKVLDLDVPAVDGLEESKRRLDMIQPLYDTIARNPEQARPDALVQLEAHYGGPEALQKRLTADQLIVENGAQQAASRARLATLYKLDPSLASKRVAQLADPKEALLPLIVKDLEANGFDGLDEKGKNRLTAYAFASGKPELVQLVGLETAAAQYKKYTLEREEALGRLQMVEQVQSGYTQAVQQAGDLEGRLVRQAQTYANRKTMNAEELKGFTIQMEQNANEAKQAAQTWDTQTSGIVDRLTKDAAAALERAHVLKQGLTRPGVDRDILDRRVQDMNAIAESNTRMADLFGKLNPYNVSMARLAKEHYELDLSTLKPGSEEYGRVQALRDAKASEVTALEQDQKVATAQLQSEQLRLMQRSKVAQIKANASDKRLHQEEKDAAAAQAWFADGMPEQTTWLTQQGRIFGASAEGFSKQTKPYVESKQEMQTVAAQRELVTRGEAALPEILKAYPLAKASEVKAALKRPDQPLVDIKMGDSLSKEIGPMMAESRNAALGALDTLDAVARAQTAIQKGAVALGPTATIRNTVAQVSQMLGVGGKDLTEQLVNTRNVMRSLAQFSLGARKQLKGQGQVSDFEGKLIVKAESGEIDDMTLPELTSFLGVTDRLARKQYANHQRNLSVMKQNPKMQEVAPFYEVPELPAARTEPSQYLEIRTGKDGKRLGKKADGTIEVIPSYQTGTPFVPETGPAILHQGEMVITKEQAAAIREQNGGPVPFVQTPVGRVAEAALTPIFKGLDVWDKTLNWGAEGLHQAMRPLPFVGDGPYNKMPDGQPRPAPPNPPPWKGRSELITGDLRENISPGPSSQQYMAEHEARRVPTGNFAQIDKDLGGMYGKGNISLNERPVHVWNNSDYSSLESITIEDGGKYILIPSVINGKIVPYNKAIDHYEKTGEFLGKFDTDSEATNYAIQLERRQQAYYESGPGRSILDRERKKIGR